MKRLSLLVSTLLVSWVLVSSTIYILVSRATYVQIFVFPEMLPRLPESFVTPHWLNFIGEMLRAISGISLFALAVFLCGAAFFRWQELSLPNLLSAFTLGEILLSVILLSLLLLTGLQPIHTAAGLTLCALPGAIQLGYAVWKNATARHAKSSIRSTLQVFDWLPLLVFIFALGLSSARLSYDAVAYYFSHSRLMAVTGQAIFFYPADDFVVSSFHPGILFTAVIQLFGDQAARMLSWVNGLVLLAAGWEIGKATGLSTRARFYFLTLMLTSTAFVDLLSDGKVELISTAPIAVALWWMIDSLQNPSPGRFLLIGSLLGFAIIARPYNIFLVSVFTVLFYLLQAWPVLQKNGFKTAWNFARPALWMLPPLVFMGAFHLWQNDLWLGSPLTPLTYARDLETGDWQWQFDPASLNTLRLLYPFTVTFMNTPQSLGNISPLFIGILPFLLLRKVRNQFHLPDRLRSLLLPAVVTLALWISLFFTVVEIRYVFFLWILLFLFGAQVIEAAFDTLEKGCRAILRATFALLLSFMVIRTLVISLATYSPIDANGQAHCYDISFCTFLDPLNQTAVEGERVFVLNAYRYYLRPDLFACSSQAQEYAPMQSWAKENNGAFWAELYRQGFTYLSYEKNFAEFHSHFGRIPSIESAPDWLTITVVSSTQNEKIYRLQPINPPFLPVKTCVKTKKGLWEVVAGNHLPSR